MLNLVLVLFSLTECLGKERIFIYSIVPNTGPLTGNTRVIVRGTNLEPNEEYPHPMCKFGRKSNIVKGTYVTCTPLPRNPDDPEPTTPEKTAHCIECDPNLPALEEDLVPFLVSVTGDFSDVENSVEFAYYSPPKINYIVPMYGQKNGGTVVTVYGENFIDFDQYLRCFFGTKAVPGIFISSTLMHCVAPFSDVVMAAQPFKITLNDQQTTKDDITYYYYPEPAIMRLIPNRGSTSGGSLIEIEGQYLDPFNDMLDVVNNHNNTFCKFNDAIVPATVISDAKVTCVAPPSQVARTVFVDVTLNNADLVLNPNDWTDDHLPFVYYAPAYIYNCDPCMGPKSGNTTIIVMGNNFNNSANIKCKFGSKVVNGKYLDENKIQCVSPPADNPGPVDLSVSLGEDNFGNSIRYTYFALAEVYAISPICGPRSGYTQITVYGKNFVYNNPDNVKCIFGNLETTQATIISESEIRCDSPDISRKGYKQVFFNFSVTLNGDDKSKNAGTLPVFGYYDFHSLDSIYPDFGPVRGGTVSTITGEIFKQQAVCNVTVRFGTTEVMAKSYNETAVVINTPEVGMPGTAIVQVSLNGQQFTDYEGPKNLGGSRFDRGKLEFTYYGDPLTTGFKPQGGPSSGGSIIDIFGAGFGQDGDIIYVRFLHSTNNSVIAVVTCSDVDLNRVSCITPRANPNSKAILELSRNGQNYRKVADYTYLFYASPAVISINPNLGPVKNQQGGDITVTGTDFVCPSSDCDQLTCKYGTYPYPLFAPGKYVDIKHVLCPIISYSRPEVVTIEVSTNGLDYTNNGVRYTFFDAFVLSATPKFVSEKGGTVVSVIGFGFADTGSELTCRIGDLNNPLLCKRNTCELKGKFVSDTEIQCTMPARADVAYSNSGEEMNYDEFAIEVSVKDKIYTSSNVKIRYSKDPEFLNMFPTSGSANGYTYVIFQTNFFWEYQSKDYVMRYATVKCSFTKGSNSVTVEGSIAVYPFMSEGDPNSIACLTPPWSLAESVDVKVTVNGKDFFGGFTFKYIEKLAGNLISPGCGPNSGETKVTIQGSGFNDHPGLHLRWGTESRPANTETLFVDTSGYLTGYSPKTRTIETHGGFVYVEIGMNIELNISETSTYIVYDEYTRNELLYYYYMEPTLDYLHPRGGSDLGGTAVTLYGSWFINYESVDCTPRCRFGKTVVPGEFITTVQVKCISPPQPLDEQSLVEVEISFNGQDWTQSHLKYVYFRTPVIYSINPNSGPSTGGTMIAIIGANFTADAAPEDFLCRFTPTTVNAGRKLVPAIFKSEGLIYCALPGGWGSGTEVKIDITFNGIDFTSINTKFNIFQIDYAFPRSAPNIGSNIGIAIYGSGFVPNDNATCVIENKDVKATLVTWGKVVCPIPPATGGPTFVGNVPLEVTVNGIDYKKFPRGFQYYQQPTVEDVTPLSGPVNGGSSITVFGGPFRANFDLANLTCAIGDFSSPAIIIDVHTLQCVTPSMEKPKNGTYLPVRISVNGQDYTNNSHMYSVYGLIDSAPKGGPYSGGTEILIKGFGFTNSDPRCRFGIDSNNIVVETKLIDESHMICTVPSGFKIPAGSQLPLDIPLEIGFSDGKNHPWTRTDNKFRLYEHPKILSISPTFGFVDLRYEVNITADEKKGFFPALTGWKTSNELDVMHSIVCRFGSYGDVPAVYINKTLVRCLTPETKILRKDMSKDTVTVSLALNGQNYFDIGQYTFKGTASGLWVVLMWLGLVVLIVAIVVLLGILISKYYDGLPLPEALRGLFPREVEQGRASAASGPHVVRGHDGAIRPSSVQAPPGFP